MLVLLGIFGAALLYGDGMITPAITVLSAMEGLTVVTAAADALCRAADRASPWSACSPSSGTAPTWSGGCSGR